MKNISDEVLVLRYSRSQRTLNVQPLNELLRTGRDILSGIIPGTDYCPITVGPHPDGIALNYELLQEQFLKEYK